MRLAIRNALLLIQGETRSKRLDWIESPRLPLSNFGLPIDAGPIGRGLYATELVSFPSHWKFSGAVEIFRALHECEIFKSAMLSYLYSLHLVPLQLSTFNHIFNLAGHVPCCNRYGTFAVHWNIIQLLSSSDPHKLIFYLTHILTLYLAFYQTYFLTFYLAYMYMYMYIHTYVHTYIRTYVHTYIHTYIHTYVHGNLYIYIFSEIFWHSTWHSFWHV